MKYKPNNPENRMRARALLRKLLPAAREQAAKSSEYSIEPASDVGENSIPHYKIDRCIGVHIYTGDKGGWFADLQFEGLPAGIPPVLGTPVECPHQTREEALAKAAQMLTMVIANDRPAPPAAEAKAAFPFDDLVVHVPSPFIERLRKDVPYEPTREEALESLTAFRDEVCGSKNLTQELADGLSEAAKVRLLAVCTMAILAGIVRFPEFEEKPPPPRGPLH